MNIIIVAADYPATTAMPGSPRLFNICRELSKHHVLSLCLIAPSEGNSVLFRQDPESAGVFSQEFTLPPVRPTEQNITTWWRYKRHSYNLAPFFDLRFRNPEHLTKVRAELASHAASTAASLLYIDGLSLAQFAPRTTGLPLVVDICDCLSQLYAQQTAQEKRLIRKLALLLETRSIERAERQTLQDVSLVLAISRVDREALSALAPQANILELPNGVDSNYFAFNPEAPGKKRLLFTGVMSYGPNDDAACYFAEEVFPALRTLHGEAEFWIVGPGPSARLSAFGNSPGITVHGGVPDIRPYLRESNVFVCPLRYGAGVKNKLLAAMSSGLPIVASTLSTNGIEVEDGRHLLIADDPEKFVAAIDRLFSQQEQRATLRTEARALIERQYSWSAQIAPLETALQFLFT